MSFVIDIPYFLVTISNSSSYNCIDRVLYQKYLIVPTRVFEMRRLFFRALMRRCERFTVAETIANSRLREGLKRAKTKELQGRKGGRGYQYYPDHKEAFSGLTIDIPNERGRSIILTLVNRYTYTLSIILYVVIMPTSREEHAHQPTLNRGYSKEINFHPRLCWEPSEPQNTGPVAMPA